MKLKFQLDLIEKVPEIRDAILDSLVSHLEPAFRKSIPIIRRRIVDFAIDKIKSQPEYASLLNGKLKYEFGIPNPEVAVSDILEVWANNISINYQPVIKRGTQVFGYVQIDMIKQDFEDALSSSSAIVYDNMSGISLPWLQWLLLDGSKILVRKHKVRMGPNRNSRTGMAIMVQSKENWRVPSEFAGTKNNNWVTRAIQSMNDEIPTIIEEEIVRQI